MSGADVESEYFVTAAEKAYQAILKKIINGEFQPGTRLVRRPLAQMLGMSPIPVLEAMKRLEQDGLVEYRAQWGSIVTIPTVDRIKDMFALREAVECQAVRVLAGSITSVQETALKELAAELDRLRYESDDTVAVNDYHYKFHMTLAEYSGFPSLVAALRRTNFFWLLCRGALSRRRRSPLQREWHIRLVECILSGDPETADKAMREHIRDSYIPFMEELEKSAAV
ncbi:MAG: GntR family transcriptional regulator [Treponemataceae bacterium]